MRMWKADEGAAELCTSFCSPALPQSSNFGQFRSSQRTLNQQLAQADLTD